MCSRRDDRSKQRDDGDGGQEDQARETCAVLHELAPELRDRIAATLPRDIPR